MLSATAASSGNTIHTRLLDAQWHVAECQRRTVPGMNLERVPPHQVVAVWHKVEPFLAAAFEHSAGEYSIDQLRAFLTTGLQTLLVFVEDGQAKGALTITTESYPNFSVAFVTAVGGRAIVNPSNRDALFDWCRAQGYTHIRGAAFESVARLWRHIGAREIYRTVEITL